MKRYDIRSTPQDYKVGESYIFLSTDTTGNVQKRLGKIIGTGVTFDAVSYIEVALGNATKKYAITNLNRTLYSDFYNKMDTIPDPSVLGEVTIVRKPAASVGNGEVTKVNGLPGDVTKVGFKKASNIGEVTRVKK
ncbi:hypothetical protein [Paenibacillus sp. GP183]|uniref:hypothetical protein n=1 Tax=Paenibacillus sp. GP183 TaxID=1882751 RepID=UPI000898BEE0|nr:hypothetical protein [Paenibacillus sp. GP183]SED14609.1 hypothetical protein SAMN05443246_5896 [Paenibacillus sp. GP183]